MSHKMKSMLCLKKAGGTVKVHNKDVIDNIVDDCHCVKEKKLMELKKNQKQSKKKKPSTLSAPNSASAVSVSSKSQTSQSGKSQDWLNKEAIKELQNKASNEYHTAKQLYAPFLHTEETFVKELEDFLAHKEFTDLRKKEILHKRWTNQVYEPIRKKIIENIDGSDWNSLDNHKREMHQQFLEHINKRGFVFLKDDDKEEYYAQIYQPTPVKIKPLCDPLHIQRRQRSEEDTTIMRCMTGHRYTSSDLEQVKLPPLPLIPQGRNGVNSCRWLEMPYHNIDNLSRKDKRMWEVTPEATLISQPGTRKVVIQRGATHSRKRMFTEHPPYGKPPVSIPHAPFIDPDEFSDKIVNTNPFPEHMENLKAEAVREFIQNQKYFEELEQQQLINQENTQPPMMVEHSQQQQLIENNEQQQQMIENNSKQQVMDNNQNNI